MSKTPELEGPRFKLLSLSALKISCLEVLGYEPEKRTIKGVYEEVMEELARRDHALPYFCGYCNCQIDGEMSKCWACGSVIEDEEDPGMSEAELAKRAEKLGIDPDGKDATRLRAEIEEAEREKRERTRDSDLSGIEADRINEQLGEDLPDGWRLSRVRQYTSYWDPSGKRRIAVYSRGLSIHFSVDDGLLDGIPNLEYLDPDERKRRHAGRTNYIFIGDISRDAVNVCKRVMERYSGEV